MTIAVAYPHAHPRDRFQATTLAAGERTMLFAISLTCYITWRLDRDILFTLSDTLFVVAFILRLAGGALNPQPFRSMTIPWLIGFSLVLIGLLVASVYNDAPTRWLIIALQYATAYVVLPLICIDFNRETMQRRSIALVVGVAAMEAFGAAAYWYTDGSRDATMSLSHEFITGLHRLGAFMADANWNAAMISMTLPFVLFLGRAGAIRQWQQVVVLLILCSGLLLSGSFTGFTSAIAATAAFFILAGGQRSWRPLFAIGIVGLAVFLAGIPLPSVFQARVGLALESGNIAQAGTFVGRWALIQEAWDIVGFHTFMGLGADQFREISADSAPVHNMYLLLWAEGGVVALLGWLLMIFVPVGVALTRWRTDRSAAALVLAVTLSFVAFSMASPHMYARSWAVPLILAMGVALADRSSANIPHPV